MPLDPFFTSKDHRFHPTDEMKRAWTVFLALPYEERCVVLRSAVRSDVNDYIKRNFFFYTGRRKVAREHARRIKNYDKVVRETREGKRVNIVYLGKAGSQSMTRVKSFKSAKETTLKVRPDAAQNQP